VSGRIELFREASGRAGSHDPGQGEIAVFSQAYYYFYFTVRPEAEGM
jgi:hypothetical protein